MKRPARSLTRMAAASSLVLGVLLAGGAPALADGTDDAPGIVETDDSGMDSPSDLDDDSTDDSGMDSADDLNDDRVTGIDDSPGSDDDDDDSYIDDDDIDDDSRELDIDGDGLLNPSDRDIDGDDRTNRSDRDMDGDGIRNADDDSRRGAR